MPRYIDADYADKLAKDLFKGQIGITYYRAVHAMLDAIKPVDVVRCKDCLMFDEENRSGMDDCNGFCKREKYAKYYDDFCSYGERKDGEK